MQPVDPLAQLHDILLPQPVDWWPLAWGWWLLLAAILLGVGAALFFYRRNTRRERYRKQAAGVLNEIFGRYRTDGDSATLLQQLNLLLRRTALTAHPDRFPVNIKGPDWLLWLDNHCPETQRGFSQGPGQALLEGPYQARPVIDGENIYRLAHVWIEKHRNYSQKAAAPRPASPRPEENKPHA